MFCKYCGSNKFTAHQVCRMDILVDGSGNFLGNATDDVASAIYDHEQPYGPFQCCGCGAEYDGDNIENAVAISGPVPDWSNSEPYTPLNLHLMTIPQLAEYIASQLNYSQIWKSKFPACDFAIVDVEPHKQYSQGELECIHSGASGWYGINSANFGMDSTTLFVVADMYGGGCDQVCRLEEDIGVIKAEILLQKAIRDALECCDTVLEDTILIVELLDKEAKENA